MVGVQKGHSSLLPTWPGWVRGDRWRDEMDAEAVHRTGQKSPELGT
jgi:hypothetical protein